MATKTTKNLQVYSYNIVKIEKGCFMIEYKSTEQSDSVILDKTFKSLSKALDYAMLNFEVKCDYNLYYQ